MGLVWGFLVVGGVGFTNDSDAEMTTSEQLGRE